MSVCLKKIRDIESHTNLAIRLLNDNNQHFYSEVGIDAASHRNFIKSIPNDLLWVIESGGKLCGIVSVYHIDNKNKKCEWGRFVVDSGAVGVGSIVEFMVLDFVFEKLGIHKLYCEVFKKNYNVIKMHQKFGFIVEGEFKDFIFKNNEYHDVLYLSLLQDDWKGIRPRFLKIFDGKTGTVEI